MAANINDSSRGPSRDAPEELPHITTSAERQRAFIVLFISQLAIGMGQTLVFAVLPPLARRLGMDEFRTTMIYSLSAFLWVMTSSFWGRRSDVIGRKPVLMIGILGFAISTFLIAIVVLLGLWGFVGVGIVFPLLLLGRAFFGALGSGATPAAQAYVADRTTRAQRASGVASIGAAFGIGTVVGPGVAAAFAQIHIIAPFFVVSIFAFASAYSIWRFLPEQTPPSSTLAERKKKRTTLKIRDPRVLPWVVLGVVLSISQAVVMQLMPFYVMDVLNIAGNAATQMVSVGLLAMAMATLFAQIGLIQRFDLSVQFLLRWGSGVLAAGVLLLSIGTSYGLIVSSLTLCGLGFGMLRPGLQAGASLSVSPMDQGTVAGFVGATAAIGYIVNPFIGIPLYRWYPAAPFIFDVLLILCILVFALLHPAVKDMKQAADRYEDEEDGIGYT